MSEHAHVVGDEYELDGHCMVAFPDGSVVTASRSIRLVMEGDYRVIYTDDDVVHVTVDGPQDVQRGPVTPAVDPAGVSGHDAEQSAAAGDSEGVEDSD